MIHKNFIFLFLVLFLTRTCVAETSGEYAGYCDPYNCKAPDCRCSSTEIPGGLNYSSTPQFVLLTFDDGVTVGNFDFYQRIFSNRTNRDGCPAAGTFFISHEYTDYTMVHTLYSQGHEIALHSISHNVSTDYWKNISVAGLRDEFAGERSLMSTFASIPEDSIQGIRLPFLQMSGDNNFEMMYREKFLYDCSWPTRHSKPGLWPYTLDYLSTQDCVIGPCPKRSWRGVWILPMISWIDGRKEICSMVDACLELPTTVDGLTDFMVANFNRTYLSNKAPFGFYVHAAWFNVDPINLPAYIKFINYLQTRPDVYLVGGSTVIDWVKNPVPLSKMNNSKWSSCRKPSPSRCSPKSCRLAKGEEERYMTMCSENCPSSYPWVGNPLGK